MFCSNCGDQNLDGSKFCKSCGQPQDSIIEPGGYELPKSSVMDSSNRIIQKYIEFFRVKFDAKFFLNSERVILQLGALASPLAALIGLVFGIYVAMKTESLNAFFVGVVWVLVVLICYYIGSRFLRRCNKILEQNLLIISGSEYSDVFGLLCMVSSFVLGVGGAILAIKIDSITIFWLSIGTGISAIFMASLALNPKLLSVHIDSSSTASNDGITIVIAWWTYLSVRVSGLVFGGGVIVGLISLISFIVSTQQAGNIYGVLLSGYALLLELFWVPASLLYPFGIYIVAIMVMLLIDIIKAILANPSSKINS